MLKIINTTFDDIIQVWELSRASPITKEFLDNLISYKIGKKTDTYYVFDLHNMPTVNPHSPSPETLAFNTCVDALRMQNKFKRGSRITMFMFTL